MFLTSPLTLTLHLNTFNNKQRTHTLLSSSYPHPRNRRTCARTTVMAAGDLSRIAAEDRGLALSALDVERSPLFQERPNEITVQSTLNALSKWIVAAFFGIVVIWRHDAEVLWAATGAVLNTCLSVALKRIINHQRPAPNLKSGPGMPSSHAQSIFYASVFLTLFVVKWLGLNAITLTTGAFALSSGAFLSWLRVSQKFHTINQILVGAIIGSLFAIAWFESWHAFVLKAFIRSIWIRIAVVLTSIFFCISFIFYVIRHWLKND